MVRDARVSPVACLSHEHGARRARVARRMPVVSDRLLQVRVVRVAFTFLFSYVSDQRSTMARRRPATRSTPVSSRAGRYEARRSRQPSATEDAALAQEAAENVDAVQEIEEEDDDAQDAEGARGDDAESGIPWFGRRVGSLSLMEAREYLEAIGREGVCVFVPVTAGVIYGWFARDAMMFMPMPDSTSQIAHRRHNQPTYNSFLVLENTLHDLNDPMREFHACPRGPKANGSRKYILFPKTFKRLGSIPEFFSLSLSS